MRLVTRGDDAGSCRSANLACRDSVLAGRLKNLSLMAPGPEIEHAAAVLLAKELDCDFGLHVTLNSEWRSGIDGLDSPVWGPVADESRVPLLLDPKMQNPIFTQFPQVLCDRMEAEPCTDILQQVEIEVRAQLGKLTGLGFKVSYLDEHMGVGWLPGFQEVFARIAREHGLIIARDIPNFNFIETVAADDDWAQFEAELVRSSPESNCLIVTHPGGGDDMDRFILNGISPGQVRAERLRDLQFWLNPKWDELLHSKKIIPTRYSQLS